MTTVLESPPKNPIIVVEDEPEERQALELLMKHEGHPVTSFANGEEAWLYIKELAVDYSFILFVDWRMPLMSGLELCRQIRRYGHNEHAHIIFHSGCDEENEDRAYEAGANEYWQKPTRPSRLLWRVRQANAGLNVLLGKVEEWDDVLNRRAMQERLLDEVARAKRSRKPLALLAIDIDKFKAINDEHGYAFGTEVMKALTALVKQSIRVTDHIGRYGGDEFFITLPDCQKSKAIKIADDLRRLVEQSGVVVQGQQLAVTIRVGVVVSRKRLTSKSSSKTQKLVSLSAERMSAIVLERLKRAKAAGGNKVVSR